MKNGMSTKVIELKEYSNKEVGILVQVILIEVMIIFALLSIFSHEFLNAFYVILSLILFTMAYNNKKVFKKKYMTEVYIIVGLFVLVSTVLEYLL